ncbi:MAG: hypothetical protein AAGI71_11320 [Bacteroidota bacterium]
MPTGSGGPPGCSRAALGVALLTVGVQTVRAALRDPVDALRYE